MSRSLAGAACGLSAASICLAAAGPATAGPAEIANPCQILPPSAIAAAFGVAHAPASTETSVTNVSTCSFKAGLLTISIGYTALTNPAAPLSTAKVAGIPSGLYETFGAKASQLTFNKGGAATGVYVVIRNYARIPKKKLVTLAKALYKRIDAGGSSGSGGGTLIP